MSILQRLYDSEINCSVEIKPGGGFTAWIKWPEQFTTGKDFATASACESWLDRTARELYPNSRYAKE